MIYNVTLQVWEYNVEEVKGNALKFEGFLSGFKVIIINWLLVFVALTWNGLERWKEPNLNSAWKRSLAEW